MILSTAIVDGNLQLIIDLLNQDPTIVNKVVTDEFMKGFTPLQIATVYRRVGLIKFFIDKGADPNIGTEQNGTPLMIATRVPRPSIPVIEVLLDNGAKINSKDEYGRTPLHLAAAGRDVETVRFLISRGADVNYLDFENKKPVDYATRPDIKEALSEAPEIVRVNEVFGKPNTPVKTKWMEICNVLGETYKRDLIDIIIRHVDVTNIENVSEYFRKKTKDVDEFIAYINTLNKRTLCAYLSDYYTNYKPQSETSAYPTGEDVVDDCHNETNFSMDEFKTLPRERVLTLVTSSGVKYCFDVIEIVENNMTIHPWTNRPFTDGFIEEANRRYRAIMSETKTKPDEVREMQFRRDDRFSQRINDLISKLQDENAYFPRRDFNLMYESGTRELGETIYRKINQDSRIFDLQTFYKELAKGVLFGKKYILETILKNPGLAVYVTDFFLEKKRVLSGDNPLLPPVASPGVIFVEDNDRLFF
jgi:hypothetical protein